MGTLIKNELIKLFKRKKTLVVFIGFLLLLSVATFLQYNTEKSILESNKPENILASHNKTLKHLEEEKKSVSSELKDKPDELTLRIKGIDEEILSVEKNIAEVQEVIKSGNKEPDWKVKLQDDIKLGEAQYELNKKGKVKDLEFIRLKIEESKYLLKNNIKPVEDYKVNGFNFLRFIISSLGMSFLTMGIIVFSADIVSGEYTPATLKFLLIQPISRVKVLLSKFISLVASAVTLIIGGELIFFLGISIWRGMGNANYPIIQGVKYAFDTTRLNEFGKYNLVPMTNSGSIMPVWKFLALALLIQIVYIITCCTLAFLISTIVKSSMMSMTLSIVTVIMFQFLSVVMGKFQGFNRFIVTMYSNPISLLEGNLAFQIGDPSISTKNAVIIMLVWIIICYIISHINFKKKDILI
ncbi:ABC transporter permease subunit [Hathewaya histolytica]|uniref:ABC transporter permease n=1 Tax=Hathewaya histolytica TaxID=1498 RepID=A0A4U9RYR2_HATHI|nr:ABC transporter permease subunit [Hathewaya histolytica]VTQ94360.1 ABC transporter permease [Hathewaya histolytica]